MARNLQIIKADGTYKVADCFRRHDAYRYECTLIAQANATFTFTGNTNSTKTISGLSSIAGLIVGQSITGTDIPTNTTIESIIDSATITISNIATGTHTGSAFTIGAGSWGGGTVTWKESVDGGKTLVTMTDYTRVALTQTADEHIGLNVNTGVTLLSSTSIYAVLSGSTNPVLTVGLSDNN